MSNEPALYQLLPLKCSAAQVSMRKLVADQWYHTFSGQCPQPNYRLEYVFHRMSWCPEQATLTLCPYYFDQVTGRLPERGQHWESYNLRLHCFDSWADEEQEKQRALNREQRQPCRLLDSVSPANSTYMSQLCQLQHPTTGGSISTQEYLHQMYGYYC